MRKRLYRGDNPAADSWLYGSGRRILCGPRTNVYFDIPDGIRAATLVLSSKPDPDAYAVRVPKKNENPYVAAEAALDVRIGRATVRVGIYSTLARAVKNCSKKWNRKWIYLSLELEL